MPLWRFRIRWPPPGNRAATIKDGLRAHTYASSAHMIFYGGVLLLIGLVSFALGFCRDENLELLAIVTAPSGAMLFVIGCATITRSRRRARESVQTPAAPIRTTPEHEPRAGPTRAQFGYHIGPVTEWNLAYGAVVFSIAGLAWMLGNPALCLVLAVIGTPILIGAIHEKVSHGSIAGEIDRAIAEWPDLVDELNTAAAAGEIPTRRLQARGYRHYRVRRAILKLWRANMRP